MLSNLQQSKEITIVLQFEWGKLGPIILNHLPDFKQLNSKMSGPIIQTIPDHVQLQQEVYFVSWLNCCLAAKVFLIYSIPLKDSVKALHCINGLTCTLLKNFFSSFLKIQVI